MESLVENRPLLWSVVGSILAVISLVLGSFPDLCHQFSIVEFPSDVSFLLESAEIELMIYLILAVPKSPVDGSGFGSGSCVFGR